MIIKSPDQINHLIKRPHIDRLIHLSFYHHITDFPEVAILYGPRQVGKSQEFYSCIKSLLNEDKKQDIFFYNLDLIPEEFESPEVFIASIDAQKSDPKNKTYVFLDEAQRLENIGLFTKYIYDQNRKIKFILSGSASLEIKAKIKEPLTGRKREYYLAPLTLKEIVTFRGFNTERINSDIPALNRILEDYLLFGGYPEVVTIDSKKQKSDKITEIASTYVLDDISSFFGFSNSRVMQIVTRFLAENTGNILSRDNIAKIAGIPKYQVEKALEALEKSFIIKLVSPLAKTPSKELIHRPKVFFQDLGIRNALLKKLDQTLITADKGKLFENAIAVELLSIFGLDNLRFWRTNNQTEVDFIVLSEDGKGMAYEAKYIWKKENALPKNIKSLKNKYPDFIKTASVISKSTYWKLF